MKFLSPARTRIHRPPTCKYCKASWPQHVVTMVTKPTGEKSWRCANCSTEWPLSTWDRIRMSG